MKKVILFFTILFSLFSCKKTDDDYIFEELEASKPVVDFGFHYDDYNVLLDTIKQGYTFEKILSKQNLNGKRVAEIIKIVKDSFTVQTERKRPYVALRSKDKYNKLQVLIYQPDRLNYYMIDFRDSIIGFKKSRPLSFKIKTIAGRLNGTLSSTLKKENIDASLVKKLTQVYAWSIDFFKLKKGDKFALSFTERYINDTLYDGVDSLRAAFFEYKGEKIYAFPYTPSAKSDKIDYYNQEGKALKNYFLKAPLKFVNITSKFSRNRFHPVQLKWKAHSGTDYAAPKGTPIMTTAKGIVEQTGFTAGNGNFVKVKHDGTYATQYLHMSKILVKRGQSVRQGDIIGKVGSTGLATGPHVCYRFWKNGLQVDALRLKLPNSIPMDRRNLPKFFKYSKPLKNELDSVAFVTFSKVR